MKKLSEFIREHTATRKSFDFLDHISNIREYYNNDIPSHILDRLNNDEWYEDYILENLQTHNYKKLQQVIKDTYNDKIDYFDTYKVEDNKNKQSFFIVVKNKEDINNISSDDKFLRMIEFYNYAISHEHDEENKDNDYYIFLEPIYCEKLKDFKSKCHGIAYHFCPTDKVDSILSNGLRIKNSKEDKFPKRIYLYISDKKLDCNTNKVKEFVNKVIANSDKGWCCLKINLYKSNVDIYKDSAMEDKEAYFCVNNIPSKFISKYFVSA